MKFSRALSDPPFQCTLITETQVTAFNTHAGTDRIINVCGQVDVEAMLTACPAAHGLFSRSAAHGCTQPLCQPRDCCPRSGNTSSADLSPPKKRVAWPMHGIAWHVNSIVTLRHVAADAAVAGTSTQHELHRLRRGRGVRKHAWAQELQMWTRRAQACPSLEGTADAAMDPRARNCRRAPRHAGNCQFSCGAHKHATQHVQTRRAQACWAPSGQTRTWNAQCGILGTLRKGTARVDAQAIADVDAQACGILGTLCEGTADADVDAQATADADAQECGVLGTLRD